MKNGLIASQGLMVSTPLAALVAARYWRIDVTASEHPDEVAMSEIEFRETVGGADATSPADAAARASASSEFSGFYAASLAFDGSTDVWSSNAGAPQWIQWDFVSPALIREVSILCRLGANYKSSPLRFSIQTSDDLVAFSTVYVSTLQDEWGNPETRLYNLV